MAMYAGGGRQEGSVALSAMIFIMPVAALFPLMTLEHFRGTTYMMIIVEIAWGVGMFSGTPTRPSDLQTSDLLTFRLQTF